jgi:hypothetical protein
VWRAKADADKATMIQFKAHFRLAEQDIRREAEEDTTGSLGFHGSANAVVPAAVIAPHVANQVIGAQPPPRRVPTPASYCWSHGVMEKGGHHSGTCRDQLEGHQVTATVNNKMGGATGLLVPYFLRRNAPNGA